MDYIFLFAIIPVISSALFGQECCSAGYRRTVFHAQHQIFGHDRSRFRSGCANIYLSLLAQYSPNNYI
jgi:hypothetical protein